MKLLFLAPTLDETNGWGRYAAGFLREAEANIGIKHVRTPKPSTFRSNAGGWKTSFFAMMDKNMLMRQKHNFDLIHAANESLAPLAMMLSMASGKPYLVSIHGTYADLGVYPWYTRWLFKSAFARAACLVPVSHYTEKIILKQLPQARTKIIPGGFTSIEGEKKKIAGNLFKILSVGALKPRKGFHTLIEAMKKLKDGTVLDIVGTKKSLAYTERLEKMITDMHLSQVKLRGSIPQDELDTLYAEADLFVLASEHDGHAFEGLGLVYLEALAQSVPVIGTYDSGAEDVIQDGVNGFLVKPGDIDDLANKIQELQSNRDLLAKMSTKAKKSVEDFRWEVVGNKMHELYKECLN